MKIHTRNAIFPSVFVGTPSSFDRDSADIMRRIKRQVASGTFETPLGESYPKLCIYTYPTTSMESSQTCCHWQILSRLHGRDGIRWAADHVDLAGLCRLYDKTDELRYESNKNEAEYKITEARCTTRPHKQPKDR